MKRYFKGLDDENPDFTRAMHPDGERHLNIGGA
jgi:hypothetical protein